MSLDTDIRDFLRSNDVKQIDFSMSGMRVTGHGYWELSNSFSDDPIRHRARAYSDPRFVGRYEALYEPMQDKIRLRSPDVLDTLEGRATVLHECTHAQLDLRGFPTSVRSNEAAAFVAEAIYMHICGAGFDVIDHRLTRELRDIAIDLHRQARSTLQTVEMTSEQINISRRVVVSFGYGTGHYLCNGIRGRRYRGL